MKRPSKLKLSFDLAIGGGMLVAAACFRPYDYGNVIMGGLGVLWTIGAAVTLNHYYR